jgi:ubiquinone/menaquinone biosynthesis C-methylase UbiE
MNLTLASRQAWLNLDYKKAIYAFLRSRSILFMLERMSLGVAELAVTGKRPRLPTDDPEIFRLGQEALSQLLRKDAERFADGTYPLSLLWAEPPIDHALRVPKIFFDAMNVVRRRDSKKTKVFSEKAEKLAKGLPSYYRRNFHFQSDGYLSQKSAELYEHQVELLFAGAADSMRRMILPPLKAGLSRKKRLRILDIACGVGSATKIVRAAFPDAEIRGIDLSQPYLDLAKKNLPSVNWRQGDATNLIEKNNSVDAILSVFLFHELPLKARIEVVKEASRVFLDSLQKGDDPRFDRSLLEFPRNYHEPFYKNYILNPMKPIIAKAGFEIVGEELGFFSKCIWARKL